MVGGLIEKQNVSVLQDSAAQGELHLPAAREAADARVDASRRLLVLSKAKLNHLSVNHVPGNVWAQGHHVVDQVEVREVALNVVLHVDGLQLLRRRKVLHLAVGNGLHERRLAAAVVAAHAIALPTLQVEARVVEKNLGSVAERKLAVAKVLALLVLVLLRLLGHAVLVALRIHHLAHGLGISLRHVGREVRAHRDKLPLVLVEEHAVNHARADGGAILNRQLEGLVIKLHARGGGLDGIVDDASNLSRLHGLVGLESSRRLFNVLQSLEALVGNLSGLRVRHLFGKARDRRHELGQEGGGLVGIVDELAHVVGNHTHAALTLNLLLLATAQEDGHRHGKGGVVNRLHEHCRRKLVQRLRHLGGVLDRLNHVRDEGPNVAVLAGVERKRGGSSGGILDLLLGVPHGGRHHGHDLVKGTRKGHIGALSKHAEELEREQLGLPVGLGDARKEEGLHVLDGVGVRDLDHGRTSSGSGLAQLLALLVRHGREDVWQKGEDKGLSTHAHDVGNAGNGDQGRLGRGAVRNHFGQRLHNAALGKRSDASRLDAVGERGAGHGGVAARLARKRREVGRHLGRHGRVDLGGARDGRGHELDIVKASGLGQLRRLWPTDGGRGHHGGGCRHYFFPRRHRGMQ
mmetsp:Transcript_84261/g.123256  ORF Transcript_84261/g.123256 Transcript_84261/m.123256 type:complete len:632 (-) Transcript_84261:9-1904(-)